LLAALLIDQTGKLRWLSPRAGASLAAGLLAVLALLTFTTNRRFTNGVALARDMATHAPKSRLALLELGFQAELRGDKGAAMEAYDAALAISPDILDALNNSAFIYARSGYWTEATERFEHVVKLGPDRAGAHFNL